VSTQFGQAIAFSGSHGDILRPTANAGTNQQQAGVGLVTLDGSGSSGYDSVAWTMVKLTTAGSADATGLLSSTTVVGPTFTPAAAGDTYVATLTATKGAQTDVDEVTIYVDPAAAGDSWTTLDLSATDWSSDPGGVLNAVGSTLGESSTIVTAANTGDVAADTGLLFGFRLQAAYDFLTSHIGIAFQVSATKPTGSGVVNVGAFLGDTQNQATIIGVALGIEWNSARSVCKSAAGVFGSGNADGVSVGAPSSQAVQIYVPFRADRPDANSTVNMDNSGTVSDAAVATAMGGAFTNLEGGLFIVNNGQIVTWANVVIKYKFVSVP